jgi:hypothetical protein
MCCTTPSGLEKKCFRDMVDVWVCDALRNSDWFREILSDLLCFAQLIYQSLFSISVNSQTNHSQKQLSRREDMYYCRKNIHIPNSLLSSFTVFSL